MVLTGVMKFEAKKFRPREVVKHVLHLGLASLNNKNLVLEGRIYDDVPLELIGDVLRIRQVFTNLVRYCILLAYSTLLKTFLFLFPVLLSWAINKLTTSRSHFAAMLSNSHMKVVCP